MLFQNSFTLRRHSIVIFADHIVIIFTKIIMKVSKKLKELEIMYQNETYIWISWYSKVFQFRVKKCWCQPNWRGVSRGSCIFWIFHRYRITVPSFIIAGYVWQILGRRYLFAPYTPYRWADPKKPILNRVKAIYIIFIFFKMTPFIFKLNSF